jgi:hypothetical protein
MKTIIKLSEGERIALTELKNMFPFALFCNGLVLIICAVYGFIGGDVNFSYFTGLLFGNIVGALNFYFIGFAAGRLVRRGAMRGAVRGAGHGARAGVTAGFFYGVRYLVMLALYWVLASLGVINLFVALVPLLYPSLYYKFTAIFNKSV